MRPTVSYPTARGPDGARAASAEWKTWRSPARCLPSWVVSVSLLAVVTAHSDGWTALADPTRRLIVERLAERPRAVGELARTLPVSRPAVSQHLRVLEDAGLVIDHPASGRRRIYRLDP